MSSLYVLFARCMGDGFDVLPQCGGIHLHRAGLYVCVFVLLTNQQIEVGRQEFHTTFMGSPWKSSRPFLNGVKPFVKQWWFGMTWLLKRWWATTSRDHIASRDAECRLKILYRTTPRSLTAAGC